MNYEWTTFSASIHRSQFYSGRRLITLVGSGSNGRRGPLSCENAVSPAAQILIGTTRGIALEARCRDCVQVIVTSASKERTQETGLGSRRGRTASCRSSWSKSTCPRSTPYLTNLCLPQPVFRRQFHPRHDLLSFQKDLTDALVAKSNTAATSLRKVALYFGQQLAWGGRDQDSGGVEHVVAYVMLAQRLDRESLFWCSCSQSSRCSAQRYTARLGGCRVCVSHRSKTSYHPSSDHLAFLSSS